jgi:hypothetical protein
MGKDTSLTVSLFGRDVSLGKSMDGIGKSTKSAGKALDGMAKKAGIALAAIGGMAVLAAKSAMEDAKSQTILAATLKTSAKATDAQVKSVEDYISKTSLAVGIADDDLRPAFARLSTSTKDTVKAQDLLNTAIGISAKTGKPLEDVANALGKAYDGNFGALGKLGLGIDKTTLKSKDFDKIMKDVKKTVGGFAEQESNTAEGKMRKLKIATDELKESFGYMLLPYVEKMANAFAKLLPFIERNKKVIGILAVVVGGFALAIVAVNTAFKVYQAVVKAATIIQGVFNAVMAMNPIGLIVIAVVALIALFVILYKKSDTFRNLIQGLVTFFKKIPGYLMAAGKGILNAITFPWRTGLNFISKIWNSTLGGLKFKIPDWVPLLGGKEFSLPKMPKIPAFAKGGIVNRPTIGLIGEAGPEAVIPLSKAGMMGGVTIINHIQGSVVTEKEIAVRVRNDIAQLLRRKGLSTAVLGI